MGRSIAPIGIGQDKPVFVHRPVASGAIEEKVTALKEKKRALAENLFDRDGAPTLAMTEVSSKIGIRRAAAVDHICNKLGFESTDDEGKARTSSSLFGEHDRRDGSALVEDRLTDDGRRRSRSDP